MRTESGKSITSYGKCGEQTSSLVAHIFPLCPPPPPHSVPLCAEHTVLPCFLSPCLARSCSTITTTRFLDARSASMHGELYVHHLTLSRALPHSPLPLLLQHCGPVSLKLPLRLP